MSGMQAKRENLEEQQFPEDSQLTATLWISRIQSCAAGAAWVKWGAGEQVAGAGAEGGEQEVAKLKARGGGWVARSTLDSSKNNRAGQRADGGRNGSSQAGCVLLQSSAQGGGGPAAISFHNGPISGGKRITICCDAASLHGLLHHCLQQVLCSLIAAHTGEPAPARGPCPLD